MHCSHASVDKPRQRLGKITEKQTAHYHLLCSVPCSALVLKSKKKGIATYSEQNEKRLAESSFKRFRPNLDLEFHFSSIGQNS